MLLRPGQRPRRGGGGLSIAPGKTFKIMGGKAIVLSFFITSIRLRQMRVSEAEEILSFAPAVDNFAHVRLDGMSNPPGRR